ncbi:GRB2-related adapter protein-like isoform X2 [Lates japonicus]|uniref:GRB2-related adapter protein-like isoform X2 n=1 Tax=Lates japonicus TaxID=270547 RepID=A0AAD3RHZ7_LATJO|nr:GRB2-related adapter protein-like isoform X2 [Lates japonicus]
MEAVALYTFRATEGDELSFNKGDLLKILTYCVFAIQTQSSGPMLLSRSGQTGTQGARLVAAVTRAHQPRVQQRRRQLKGQRYGDHVQHFKVLQDRCGQYYVWDELFSSLNELVEFYHSNSIAKERTVFLRDPEHFARESNRLQDPGSSHSKASCCYISRLLHARLAFTTRSENADARCLAMNSLQTGFFHARPPQTHGCTRRTKVTPQTPNPYAHGYMSRG